MTEAPTMKYQTSRSGGYDVFANGEFVGRTDKKIEHYNLHPRPATYTYWIIFRPDSLQSERRADGRPDLFITRKAAAAELLRLANDNEGNNA